MPGVGKAVPGFRPGGPVRLCLRRNGSSPDAGTVAVICPALTGVEIAHQNDITTAETWAGDGTVHHVTFGFTVRPGGTLTLAPCASSGWTRACNQRAGDAAQPAKVVSLGTADHPVLITNVVGGQKWGFWRGFDPFSTFELAYTTLENGGNYGFLGSSLENGVTGSCETSPTCLVPCNASPRARPGTPSLVHSL